VLEARGIHAGYQATPVLRDVDLTVPRGAVVALLGPNGAGKTTLLRVLSGTIPPTAGTVRLDGQDITTWPPHRRLRAGMALIPEGRGIFRELTVRVNLALFAAAVDDGDAEARAVEAFPKLGQRLDQVAGTLSGGEQQMLSLCRAHIGDPGLVLLDEVSMGLAPVVVDEIFAFLARLAASGRSLLLVEQYVDRALAIADYVYLLDRGRVAFAGEPAELAADDVFARYLAGEPA
jgi:branched-chain amino acid transport system ATP-binding protein